MAQGENGNFGKFLGMNVVKPGEVLQINPNGFTNVTDPIQDEFRGIAGQRAAGEVGAKKDMGTA